jgi:hypothetical protein
MLAAAVERVIQIQTVQAALAVEVMEHQVALAALVRRTEAAAAVE